MKGMITIKSKGTKDLRIYKVKYADLISDDGSNNHKSDVYLVGYQQSNLNYSHH